MGVRPEGRTVLMLLWGKPRLVLLAGLLLDAAAVWLVVGREPIWRQRLWLQPAGP